MNHNQPPNRIPAEDVADYKTWSLPVIDNNGQVLSSAEKEANDQRLAEQKREQESIENVELPLNRKAGMTAQDMQEIFDEAERAGFAQGHQEGSEKGRAEGYEAGQQQGLMEMRQQLVAEQQRFQKLTQALLHPLQEQDSALETMLLETICTLTRSVVERELITDSSQIVSLVKAAVAALPVGSKHLRIKLNPDDLAAVERYAQEQQLDWAFLADASIQAGGCLVETADSRVNFTVDERLKNLLDQFVNKQLGDSESSSDEMYTDAHGKHKHHPESSNKDADSKQKSATNQDELANQNEFLNNDLAGTDTDES